MFFLCFTFLLRSDSIRFTPYPFNFQRVAYPYHNNIQVVGTKQALLQDYRYYYYYRFIRLCAHLVRSVRNQYLPRKYKMCEFTFHLSVLMYDCTDCRYTYYLYVCIMHIMYTIYSTQLFIRKKTRIGISNTHTGTMPIVQ